MKALRLVHGVLWSHVLPALHPCLLFLSDLMYKIHGMAINLPINVMHHYIDLQSDHVTYIGIKVS
jgi:hypothetical protein